MRTISSLGLVAAMLLFTGEAKPCGGAFGTNYTIQPDQKIIVSYHGGVETYVMNPNFCGKADTFGLILPIPSVLMGSPTLETQLLYSDLGSVAAPTIVTTQQCLGKSGVGGSSGWGTGSSAVPNGTTVIQRGQVGIFDYALLRATSVGSFTDWLSANGFPNQAAATTFQPYVDQGWYFVAFKVSAGATGSETAGAGGGTSTRPATTTASGGAGATICGSFGPIALAFSVTPQPVIPARIATVSSSSFQWDIFAIGAQQMRLQNVSTSLRFSGPLGQAELTKYPSIAAVAKEGDRLTELLLTTTPTNDLILEPNPSQSDFRRTETVINYVQCSGGATGAGGTGTSGGSVGVGGSSSGGMASGGTSDQAGQSSSGSALTTGGSLAAGGQLDSGTGGTLTTDGQKATGGKPVLGSQIVTGGTSSVVGQTVTGSTSVGSNAGSNPNFTSQNSARDDDGACSVASIAVGRVQRGFAWISLLLAIVTVERRRTAKRRTDRRRS